MPLVAYNALVLRQPYSGVEHSVAELARALLARAAFDYTLIRPPAWCRGRGLRILHELTLLPALLRRRGAALLHAPAYVAPPRLPCPFVLSIYDLHVYTHPRLCGAANRLHYRARLPGSVRRAAAVIVPSRHTRATLLARFPAAAAKTHVIPLGVAGRFFLPPEPHADRQLLDAVRRHYELPPRYLLFVGDLAPRKNLGLLLRSWELLRQRDGALQLLLAGAPGGVRLPKMTGLRRLGYVPDEELPALYAQARALLLPSVDEGFGLPVLEAMAAGCPALCAGGAPAEFAAGAALLCDSQEPVEIARRVAPLLADGPVRDAAIAVGRARAAQFTWERAAAMTEAVYRDCLRTTA